MFSLSEAFWYSACIDDVLRRETRGLLANCSWKYRRLSLEFKLNYKQTTKLLNKTKLHSNFTLLLKVNVLSCILEIVEFIKIKLSYDLSA